MGLKKKIRYFLIVLLINAIAPALYAQENTELSRRDSLFLKDNPIVSALDSMAAQKFFSADVIPAYGASWDHYILPADSVPVFPDSIIKSRIAHMNAHSPFEFVFNEDVKKFIELYSNRRRRLTARMLGEAEYYFPLFEEQLDKHDVPLELKYLPIIESAMNPRAKSRAGAMGLWQFMYNTGKMYDLKVTSYIDERCDPYQSTIAAAQHLKDLYDIYGDWAIVLAAYNAGPGNVNRAIRRAGLDTSDVITYWRIQSFLPRETQRYVPGFIAACYMMNYAKEYNIIPRKAPLSRYEVDTVTVTAVVSFTQLSEFFCADEEELKFMNPVYKKGIIPGTIEEPMTLTLPRKIAADFINNDTILYAYKTEEEFEREKWLAGNGKSSSPKSGKSKYIPPSTGNKQIHTVRSGESLNIIAHRYRCSVSELKSWNNLRGNMIHPNQKLIIYSNIAQRNTNTARNSPKRNKTKFIYHTVRKGDTLWDIANRYKGASVDEIKKLNKISSPRDLVPGQKLKIAVEG